MSTPKRNTETHEKHMFHIADQIIKEETDHVNITKTDDHILYTAGPGKGVQSKDLQENFIDNSKFL
jgi:hypothetical protein